MNTGTHEETEEKLMTGMKAFSQNSADYFPRPFVTFFDNSAEKVDHLSVADRLRQIKPEVSNEVYNLLTSTWGEYISTDNLEDPVLSQGYRWAALTGHDMDEFQDTFELYSIKDGTKALIESIYNDS